MTQALDLKSSNHRNFKRLLNIAVETTRKMLKCDRVIVYSASKLPEAIVLAESIVYEYVSILGQTIKDPFLEDEYLKMYCQGRVVTIDNIYTTDKDRSELEVLERLEVKSLAIAPIFDGKKLLALLVAQKCSQAQPWQPEKVDMLTERASTVGIVLANIFNAEKLEDFKPLEQTTAIQQDRDFLPQKQQAKIQNGIQPIERAMTIQKDISPSLTEIENKIAEGLNIEDILNTTVEETRHFLECDRVVVYCLDGDNYGVVIAESVASGWTKALGRTVDDPCFEFIHLKKYRNGRVRAWDDIYCDDATPCYLEQLEALEVKANLVAPIVIEQGERLFGLLIAHQCSETRHWQQQEINSIIKIATQLGLMLEKIFANSNRTKQKSLAESESILNEHFVEAIQHIGQFSEREDILKASVEEVRRVLKCDRTVIYSLDRDNYGVVVAESVAPRWTKALGKVFDDPCLAVKYIEEYSNGRVRALNDIYSKNVTECYQEQLAELEVKANLVAPIIREGRLYGLLISHQCSDTRNWQQLEIDWMAKIADRVGQLLELSDSEPEVIATAEPKAQNGSIESERDWNQHLTDAIAYIRQSLELEDILKASVKEVRRVLKCDRVVVYSLNKELRYSTVIAESVAPGWTRALDKKIDDPCFEPTYREKYLNGRVRAWNDIYESSMTKCYIEQLEQLEVKANLVTPIINEGQLFGLLVAHQCSEARNWQQSEINWVAQIAMQVGFALDNAKLLAETKQLKHQLEYEAKLNKSFTDATRYIRDSLEPEDILEVTVEEVRQVLNCDRTIVYSLNRENYGVVVAESTAAGWTEALGRMIDDPCLAVRYIDEYRNGRVRALNDVYSVNVTPCYLEQLEELEVKANLVAPIVKKGQLYGLLISHQCSEARNWQQPEIDWIEKIAIQVGLALENAERLAEAQALERRVEDETKWTEYFTDAVRVIRQSLKQEDILKASVKEVRRVLKCDRVVVYSLNRELRYGTVIAESVTPSWTRALDKKIDDPCFEPTYREKYLNGRVRAWNNIYESGMTDCYIRQLEQLQVKANLVTPIINEGKLFGLLVAHQCSEFRSWQQSEIRWVAQIATQVGFAIDNAKLLRQIEHNVVSDGQSESTEILKHHLAEILTENEEAYKTLSPKAMRQSETTLDVLHQIQGVADSASDMALNVQQIEFQKQQNDLVVRATQETLERAINRVSNIQGTVQNASTGLDDIAQTIQKLSKTVNLVKDVSKQIVQQSMNITRAVNRASIEGNGQNSLIDLSDTVFSLMQQLFEATAQVDPLFATVKLEIREKTIALDSGTQLPLGGVEEFHTIRQQLERVVALNQKINNSIEKIARAVEHQLQGSTVAKNSVREVADIAEQISEQSMTVTQSFNKLVVSVRPEQNKRQQF